MITAGWARVNPEEVLRPPRVLGRVEDIPENGAKGFPGVRDGVPGLVAVRQGEAVYVYENACPHIGTPLDWYPDRFLSHDGRHLVCATHGAAFEIATGMCFAGPCRGDALTPVECVVRDGVILLV